MEYVIKNEVLAMLNRIGGCDAEEGSWTDGWDKAVGEAYHRVSNMGNCELKAICKFAEEADFFFDVCKRQLRRLWTAFCIHSDYECDTRGYDNDLREVWEVVKQNKSNPWDDGVNGEEVGFDLLDDFMCEEIV